MEDMTLTAVTQAKFPSSYLKSRHLLAFDQGVRYSARGEDKAKMSLPLARADLESLLRARQLDRTLTTHLPALPPGGISDEYAVAPVGITALDARFGGGFPRGHISEIVGARSSGRASLWLQACAAATTRQELVALIDVLDMLDVDSAEAAGVDLGRLLWIRGQVVSSPGLCGDRNQRALDQAIKAITLVLQAGNFGLVVFDAGEAPGPALARLPFTTWRRLQRIIEGSQTACVLVGSASIARSAGGVTVRLEGKSQQPALKRQKAEPGGIRVEGRLFTGLDVEMGVVRAHARADDDVCVRVSTYRV
jgi:hypothetical protein